MNECDRSRFTIKTTYLRCQWVNTLRPRQNGRRFANDIFKCIFLKENVWILLKISLKYIPKVPFNNIPSLVQIMAWRRPGDKPLSEPMMVSLLTHICVTQPQWVNMLRWVIGLTMAHLPRSDRLLGPIGYSLGFLKWTNKILHNQLYIYWVDL